jgi:GNAT superfamily N-acetyltransferase
MAPSDPTSSAHGLSAPAPLRAAEIGDAQALVAEVGWNQTQADWRAFLDFGHVQAVRRRNGQVIATAATLPYGAFGWISMVLVSEAFRRQGLASRLLRGAIDDLIGAGLVPVLDATPAGREVYRKLGFNDTWGFARLARHAAPAAARSDQPAADLSVRAITDADWPALCIYDARAFGADRSSLLARLRGRLPPADLVALRDGRLAGFLLGRDGRIASQLGPLIADDDATARALLERALAGIDGPVFIDVADSKRDTLTWLAGQGFAPARPLTRMVHQRSAAFDDGVRTFAVVGPEFG